MTLFGIKLGVKLIGAIVLVALILLLVTCGPAACNKIRSLQAQMRVNEGQGNAFHDSAKDAINTQSGVNANAQASEDLTRLNTEEIRNAEGAGNSIAPAVNDAFLRAVCRRAASRNDPKCRVFLSHTGVVE